MNITLGGTTFDHASYDAEGDVLYLSVGSPQAAAETDETPEGHAVRYDAQGHVIGLTIVNARWLLERDGAITITPSTMRLDAETLQPALTGES